MYIKYNTYTYNERIFPPNLVTVVSVLCLKIGNCWETCRRSCGRRMRHPDTENSCGCRDEIMDKKAWPQLHDQDVPNCPELKKSKDSDMLK